jgi:hypothetical protein
VGGLAPLSPFSAALLDSQLSLLGLGRTRFAHSVLRTKQGIAATATRLASHDRNSKRDLRLASASTFSLPRLQTLAASSPLHRLSLVSACPRSNHSARLTPGPGLLSQHWLPIASRWLPLPHPSRCLGAGRLGPQPDGDGAAVCAQTLPNLPHWTTDEP